MGNSCIRPTRAQETCWSDGSLTYQGLSADIPDLLALLSTKNVHSMCVAGGRTMGPTCVGQTADHLHKNDAKKVYCSRSRSYPAVRALAHNFVHKKCAKGAGGGASARFEQPCPWWTGQLNRLAPRRQGACAALACFACSGA